MPFNKKYLLIPVLMIIFLATPALTSLSAENNRQTEILQVQNTLDEDLITGRELKAKTVSEVAKIYQIDAKAYAQKLSVILGYNIQPNNSFQLLHDNYGLEPSVAKDIALGLKTNSNFTLENIGNKKSNGKKYDLVLIIIILSTLYLISKLLAKKSIITSRLHCKIWNWILLLSFIISGVLGILLVVKENFGLAIPLPFSIVYWHAEIGIIFLTSSALHIITRRKQLK